MSLGLISHSRGNVQALRQAIEVLLRLGCDRALFLGYDDEDLHKVKKLEPARAQIDNDLDFLQAVSDFVVEHQQKKADADSDIEHFFGLPVQHLVEPGSRRYEKSAKTVFDLIDSSIVLAICDKAQLCKDDIRNAAIIVHASADKPDFVQIGTRVFIAPGALDQAGGQVSILHSDDAGFVLSRYNFAEELLHRRHFTLRKKTKMTVK